VELARIDDREMAATLMLVEIVQRGLEQVCLVALSPPQYLRNVTNMEHVHHDFGSMSQDCGELSARYGRRCLVAHPAGQCQEHAGGSTL